MALLEAHGLVKFYGRRCVVDGVNFDVNAGEVVGLLGPNGAGKTTSFKMTMGFINPNGGKVLFNGHDVTTELMYKRARLGMGYLPQETSVFRKLTVEQNIVAILEMVPMIRSMNRKLTRAERWDRTDKVLTQFGLLHVRKNVAARLSGGEKRRLEIARCLVCEPLLILMDEPFTGIDPKTIADIQQIVKALRDQGIGILLTDHNVREALKITTRSYLIKDGKVRTHGTPYQIINDPIAINEYLGAGFNDDSFARNPDEVNQPPKEPVAVIAPIAVSAPVAAAPAPAEVPRVAPAPAQAPRVAPAVPAPAASAPKATPSKAPAQAPRVAPAVPAPAASAPKTNPEAAPSRVAPAPPPAPAPTPKATPAAHAASSPTSPEPPAPALRSGAGTPLDELEKLLEEGTDMELAPPPRPVQRRPRSSNPSQPAQPEKARTQAEPKAPSIAAQQAEKWAQEKPERLIEHLKTSHADLAASALIRKGSAAVPVLLAALERRDAELRKQVKAILEKITQKPIPFEPYAQEAVRMKQLASLRETFERKAG